MTPPRYMYNQYGQKCRVVVVPRQQTHPMHYPVAMPRQRRHRGCLFPILVVIAVIGSIYLILLLMSQSYPQTSLGYAGSTVSGWLRTQQNILAGGGIGMREITVSDTGDPPPTIMIPGHELFTAESDIRRTPSLSAQDIDRILVEYGSPAEGTGQDWYDLGVSYGIDPAVAVAFFVMESSAGTHPQWAGWKGDGTTTHNVGNIICAGYATCYGRFRDYPTWHDGIADWYRLLNFEYMTGRNATTLNQIIPIYAPAFENDVQGYITTVVTLVNDWQVSPTSGRAELWMNATICEGTGWHDGAYDFCAPEGTTVYAPTDLYFDSTGRYDDFLRYGDYWMGRDRHGIEWYFGHLQDVLVVPVGTLVAAGTPIGALGPFSYTIPHTHIQIKKNGLLVSADEWMRIWEGR